MTHLMKILEERQYLLKVDFLCYTGTGVGQIDARWQRDAYSMLKELYRTGGSNDPEEELLSVV